MGNRYESFIANNPKEAKKFLNNDATRKSKPFENVSFNRNGKYGK